MQSFFGLKTCEASYAIAVRKSLSWLGMVGMPLRPTRKIFKPNEEAAYILHQ